MFKSKQELPKQRVELYSYHQLDLRFLETSRQFSLTFTNQKSCSISIPIHLIN